MAENYNIRLENAKNDIKDFSGDIWQKAVFLHDTGYSLRIIEEILGISRSKLQRFLSENNHDDIDDVRTQNRNHRVNQATRLRKMGFEIDEIAAEMDINVRTVESYLRQAGMKASTKFGGV